MKRLLQLIVVAVAAYGLYELADHYLWRASKSTKKRRNTIRAVEQPKPSGTQVGGAVLTGGGTGGRLPTDEDGGDHTSTVVGRGIVNPRSNA